MLAEGLDEALEWADVPAPATMKEVLDTYDRQHDALTKGLHALTPAQWERKVPFMYQGQEVMSETGYGNAWGFSRRRTAIPPRARSPPRRASRAAAHRAIRLSRARHP